METYQDCHCLSKRKKVGAGTSWKRVAVCKEENECVTQPCSLAWCLGYPQSSEKLSPHLPRQMRSLAGAKPMSWGHSGSTLKDILSFRMAEGHFALLIFLQCGCLSKVTSVRKIQKSHINHPPSTPPFFLNTKEKGIFLFLIFPWSFTECASAKTKGLAFIREAKCWRPPDGHSSAPH